MKIDEELAKKLIKKQFPEFAELDIVSVRTQGHDNRSFRLGSELLIRMPTAESYALKIPKEQELLPILASHLKTPIPAPLKIGQASEDFPFDFSIYKWLEGESANHLVFEEDQLEILASELADFLKNLQDIDISFGLEPGLHNWWRGAHIKVYDDQTQTQMKKLAKLFDTEKALNLWNRAMKTSWSKKPVWVHGDFAVGNFLVKNGRLAGVIDFGGVAIGDPACDLVIAWKFLKGNSRKIFQEKMGLDEDTWLRARAWALWKSSYELCQMTEKNEEKFQTEIKLIEDLIN